MGKVVIRNLERKDIDAVTAMMARFRDVYPVDYICSSELGGVMWLLEYVLETKDPLKAGSFVLEREGTVIGHIAYMWDMRSRNGKVYEAFALVVDKQYHRKGYGRRLVRHLERELKKIGARAFSFQTGIRGLPYCRELKFKQFGLFPHYWESGENCYMMGRHFYPSPQKKR